jgi:thiol-disulfide isomerase/thioredoxin
VRIAAIAVGIALVASDAHAGQATCSNPGLPVGAAASSDLFPGRLTLSLTTSLLTVSSSEVLAEGQGQVRYDADLALVETRLTAELALRSWLAVALALPYRAIDVGVAYRDPATGAPVMSQQAGIHARDERLHGIGDPSLTLHGARELASFRFHARLGTTVPLGHTEEDPFLLGQIGQEHQHVQFGTGTLIPFVALEAQRSFGPVTGAAWGIAQLSLYDNDHGYRAGDRYSAGVNASSSLGTKAFTFGVSSAVHTETAETWQGIVHIDEGNAGRLDVLAGGSVAWRPAPGFAVLASVELPVYSDVTGPQVDYGIVGGLGLVTSFDLASRASYGTADVTTLGIAGTATPLVPVPGTITVFDLWAEWCAPCRELDDKLAALARRHPERFAVRKLDVVDNDSAAWLRYLAPGSFELPHIKVYGADGVLLFEKTAPPDELIRAVEAALR